MIREPSSATLKKYGLDIEAWREMWAMQGEACAICQKEPRTGRTVIDHEHVPKWKQLPPELRRRYVRAICCWFCNHSFLRRGMTVAKAYRIAQMLTEYELRKSATSAARDTSAK